MLEDKKLKAFVPTVDPEKSRDFYMNVLGLTLLSEDQYGMEFISNGAMLRITTVQKLTPQPFTVLGWDVVDLPSVILSLAKKGIEFERYNFIEQDIVGIWTAPGGVRVAWFKDPDGNLLSLSEMVNSTGNNINHL